MASGSGQPWDGCRTHCLLSLTPETFAEESLTKSGTLFSHPIQINIRMNTIQSIRALEILDSRGNPTLSVTVALENGLSASASVPSGASTGTREAVELRDGEKTRYQGKGVRQAVSHVEEVIAPTLKGADPVDQSKIDHRMKTLDGTPNKARLGANALLGVSMAVARVAALAQGIPLYVHLGRLAGHREGQPYVLPTPMMNVLNGGRHAQNNVDFQEFMIFPTGARTFSEALRYGAETFHVLKELLHEKGLGTGVGDEGGFAPSLSGNDQAVDLIVEAIGKAGFRPGADIALALDPAASEFYATNGNYVWFKSSKRELGRQELLGFYLKMLQRHPYILSLEDGIAEQDDRGWAEITEQLGGKIQLVGDDNFVTNPEIFRQGIANGVANAILIKLNQIGTVTETLETVAIAKEAKYGAVISHRSGETEDTFIADFAVATGVGQIKTGSLCRSERIAKYNRLLAIERELGEKAEFAGERYLGKKS
jgi:enolase